MTIIYWIAAAGLAVLVNRRVLRRLIGRYTRGRTRVWSVRVRGDGSLTAYGWRLRIYGIAPNDGNAMPQMRDALCQALSDAPIRLRVVAVDADGSLVVVARSGRKNLAIALLRAGLARSLGTGTRRYRQAQAVAEIERVGMWRDAASDRSPPRRRFELPVGLVFPWWQG